MPHVSMKNERGLGEVSVLSAAQTLCSSGVISAGNQLLVAVRVSKPWEQQSVLREPQVHNVEAPSSNSVEEANTEEKSEAQGHDLTCS